MPMKLGRRAFVALALATCTVAGVTSLSSAASADVAPSPTTVHLVGQRSSVTAGEPTHATFELQNVSAEAIEVYLYRAILSEGGTNHPLNITRVEIDGREVPRTVPVGPRTNRRVTVFFAIPQTLRGRNRWSIDLRITTTGFGGWDSQPAEISRVHRDPARKLVAGVPKAA